MGVLANLPRARGKALPKLADATKSITGTGSFSAGDFGLSSIIAPLAAMILDNPTTIPNQVVEISGWSTSAVDVVVVDQTITGGAEHAISGTARSVKIVVVGE